ncbi:hypothetical protein [Streptacidiphilus fuscans]|uniref:Uncharacterized protein n=1 Tax=Streptacidiphilus fuscans TaxID=2789292 RepID=A0A931BAE0_9ACTN|nr:hypothetical protein [Streptacidiphilus fuscans]MBF9070658.1 hypothetical protein [Streptacidiphilus fuscans]
MKKLWVGRTLAGVMLAAAALTGFAAGHGTSRTLADSQWGGSAPTAVTP